MADEEGGAAAYWTVVGGSDAGGILVREGRELASPQLPERLGTGAVVQQLQLVGSRLRFRKVSGPGPESGWVSTKQKDRNLVAPCSEVDAAAAADAATDPAAKGAEDNPTPLLVCFYSGGMTARQGRAHLAPFLVAAAKVGLGDPVVLDHGSCLGCGSWDAYLDQLVESVSGGTHAGRPILIFAHSHGCLAAYGLALRLGARALKLYVAARRPPSMPLLDEVWGVDCGGDLEPMADGELLQGLLSAWRNPFLQSKASVKPVSPVVSAVMQTVRQQYSSPSAPSGSADIPLALGEPPKAIAAPILAVACGRELDAGETAEKMEGWRELTTDTFRLLTVDADHMECMQQAEVNPLFEAVLGDMRQFSCA